MSDQPKEERRVSTPLQVVDRPLEAKINLNNIITSLILAGIIGSVTILWRLDNTMREMSVTIAVGAVERADIRRDLEEHIHNPYAHNGKYVK